MKKVYIMIAAVTFVVGFVLGAVLLLASVTRKIESCEDGDIEELRRIDGINDIKRKLIHIIEKEKEEEEED